MTVRTVKVPAAGALDKRELEISLDPHSCRSPVVGFVIRDGAAWHEGLGVTAEDAKDLAWAILEEYYDVDVEADGGILVSEKQPEPDPLPKVEVGQFYRVVSSNTMMKAFQGNPIVKVTSVSESTDDEAFFTVETQPKAGAPNGRQSSWHFYRGEEPTLIGPIKVKEETTVRWVEA